MPGRFAETLDSCRLRRQPRHFFHGKNPGLGVARPGLYAGQARQWSAMKNDENFNMSIRHVEAIRFQGQQGGRPRLLCRAGGAAGRLRCRAGGAAGLLCRAGMWRARYRSRWASHQTRLGEPVLKGPLGEPVLILGEPVLIGRASTHWPPKKESRQQQHPTPKLTRPIPLRPPEADSAPPPKKRK